MRTSLILVSLGLLAVTLACSLLGTPPAPTAALPSLEPGGGIPPDVSLAPTATEAPTALPPTPTVAAPGYPEFTFSWLKLQVPPGVAAGGLSNVVPAVPASDQVAPWEVAPLHEEVPLSGYALSMTFHEARIYIYPVADFATLDPGVGERAAALQKLLAEKPAEPGSVPLLPIWNAGQMFLAAPAYLEFQNGSGIRYLAMYGQSFAPVNNHDLFYSFQGLTSDGRYWASAILPIQHPSLQPTYDNPLPPDFELFASQFESYTAQVRAALEAQPPDSFTPTLSELDAMVASMTVGPLGP